MDDLDLACNTKQVAISLSFSVAEYGLMHVYHFMLAAFILRLCR